MILFHGTGALRSQSIKERGLLPKQGSYVYASPLRMVAVVFAAARGELEDQWGLLVKFNSKGEWETDELFPNSVRSSQPVPPEDILSMELIHPEEEVRAHQWVKRVVELITLE